MYIRVHRSTSMEHLILTVLKTAETRRVKPFWGILK